MSEISDKDTTCIMHREQNTVCQETAPENWTVETDLLVYRNTKMSHFVQARWISLENGSTEVNSSQIKLKGLGNSLPSWIFLEAILVNSVAILMSVSSLGDGVDVGKLYSTK